MLPQFAETAASFSRASTLMLRMGTDAHLYDDPQDANINSLLDSKFDSEKVEALKRLLALMSQGCDVSNFFPQVVKNVASQSLEVKKLVYIYLVHYAERRPDEALLSINSFQKDLSDLNPLVRAWALRAMSGIHVHVVAPLVLMAVTKCSRDPSPYVRRCAANAIPKLYDLDREQNNNALEELIGLLFNDNSAGVIGATAAAFNSVCPNNLSLIGSKFKRLCETLPDVEEWGQIILIEILLRYVVAKHGISKISAAYNSGYTKRLFIERETSDCSLEHWNGNKGQNKEEKNIFPGSDTIDQQSRLLETTSLNSDSSKSSDAIPIIDLDNDVKLLLQCTSPLFWSQNSGVVLAAAGVHWLMAPMKEVKRIVKPLLFLLRSSYDSQYVVLANLATFVGEMPSLFEQNFEDFFIRSSDTYHMRAIKLEILSIVATESSIHTILQELQDYVRDPDRKFAADAVAAIGKCAKRLPTVALTCLKGLLALVRKSSVSLEGSHSLASEKTGESMKEKFPGIKAAHLFRADFMLTDGDKDDSEASVLTQTILAIKTILQQNPDELEKVFVPLIRSLDLINVPTARAIIIWMVGEYSSTGTVLPKIVPTLLQYLAACFPTEGLESKLQILNCAAKVILHCEASCKKAISLVVNYVLDLGRCDLSYDVRDRARMLKQLLAHSFSGVGVDGENEASQTYAVEQIISLADLPQCSGVESERSEDNSERHVFGKTIFQQHDPHGNLVSAIAKYIFSPKLDPVLHSTTKQRLFLPGSLSHIVQHTAPGYRPLPKPFSLSETCIPCDAEVCQPIESRSKTRVDDHDSSGDDTDYIYSSTDRSFSEGSLQSHISGSDPENDRLSDSESPEFETKTKDKWKSSPNSSNAKSVKSKILDSNTKMIGNIKSKSKEVDERHTAEPLIFLSDSEHGKEIVEDGSCVPVGSDCLQLMREDALESWLGPEVPISRPVLHTEESVPSGYASLSIGALDAELRKHTLLDFTNGDGMNVMYAFSKECSSYSSESVCVRLFFENRSLVAFTKIIVRADDSIVSPSEPELPPTQAHGRTAVSPDSPTVIPTQEIPFLEAGETTQRDLHVCFHQLTPLKLGIHFNNKCYSVRLMPEIGALLRPLSMNLIEFTAKESQISGMLEYSRRCTFRERLQRFSNVNDFQLQHDKLIVVARNIASRVLSRVYASILQWMDATVNLNCPS
ncbi:hypothetical protein SUGI_0001410 [Cryptomeria japonica]|nr:hypothetical protein SUGI_0001410 [Cryptomeria japonica]